MPASASVELGHLGRLVVERTAGRPAGRRSPDRSMNRSNQALQPLVEERRRRTAGCRPRSAANRAVVAVSAFEPAGEPDARPAAIRRRFTSWPPPWPDSCGLHANLGRGRGQVRRRAAAATPSSGPRVRELAEPPEQVAPAIPSRCADRSVPIDRTTSRPAVRSSSASWTPVWPLPTRSTPPGRQARPGAGSGARGAERSTRRACRRSAAGMCGRLEGAGRRR